jgi:hypothetical protein
MIHIWIWRFVTNRDFIELRHPAQLAGLFVFQFSAGAAFLVKVFLEYWSPIDLRVRPWIHRVGEA